MQLKEVIHYRFENGDQVVICDIEDALSMLKAETEAVDPSNIELFEWKIRPVILTEKEIKKLPKI